jgi:hypothetical protein
MSGKRVSMIGVQDRNHTAVEATAKRRAALREDNILATAYRREPQLCIHVPYKSFCGKVRAITEQQRRPLREVAHAWVDKWMSDRAKWQRARAQSPQRKVRVLPDGKRVFYT